MTLSRATWRMSRRVDGGSKKSAFGPSSSQRRPSSWAWLGISHDMYLYIPYGVGWIWKAPWDKGVATFPMSVDDDTVEMRISLSDLTRVLMSYNVHNIDRRPLL